jgi:anti-sigma28 factor (negative regulator of flagellin synthesis)
MIAQVSPITRSSNRAPSRRDRFMLVLTMVHSRVKDEVAPSPTQDDTPSGGRPAADAAQARKAKIATLRRAHAIGAYNVGAEQIAEKIIAENLVDLLV